MHRRLLARPGRATCCQLHLISNDLLLQRCDEHENEIEHITHIPSRSDCQVLFLCTLYIHCFLKKISIRLNKEEQMKMNLN